MTGAVSTTGFPPRFILMGFPGRREALNDVQRRVVGTGLLLGSTIAIGDSPLVGRFDQERRVVPELPENRSTRSKEEAEAGRCPIARQARATESAEIITASHTKCLVMAVAQREYGYRGRQTVVKAADPA